MADDHRTLLHDLIASKAGEGRFPGSEAILAASVPWLCSDCEGTGWWTAPHTYASDRYYMTCPHPSAPTIADLLRWGENVAKAEMPETRGVGGHIRTGGYVDGQRDLLTNLRCDCNEYRPCRHCKEARRG